jgi:hypothetical protein
MTQMMATAIGKSGGYYPLSSSSSYTTTATNQGLHTSARSSFPFFILIPLALG